MFRLMEQRDFDDVVDLCREYVEALDSPVEIPNESKLRALVDLFFKSPNHLVLLKVDDFDTPVGIIAGFLVESFASTAKLAVEQIWFIRPSHRGKRDSILMPALFEEWAKRRGCDSVILTAMEKQSNAGKLYERLGYTVQEHTYRKDISINASSI